MVNAGVGDAAKVNMPADFFMDAQLGVLGIASVFKTYRELEGEPGIRAFRELSEALSWLSLSAGPDPGLFTRLNPAGGGA